MSLAELKGIVASADNSGSIAMLQRHLAFGMINPEPPDVEIGTTAFCTFRNFDELSRDKFMWVALQGRDKDSGENLQYQINVEGEGMIWVDAKYVWTKEQVAALVTLPPPVPYVAPWNRNVTLPEGVKVKDPEAVIQALLNLLRDANVMGLAGHTNLAAVKCKVDNLCLGHFNKVADGLGPEVCDVLNKLKDK